MKARTYWRSYWPHILVGGTLLLLLLLSHPLHLSATVTIILVVVLAFLFTAMALWSYANRHADGSEWWQDDDASGWRGY